MWLSAANFARYSSSDIALLRPFLSCTSFLNVAFPAVLADNSQHIAIVRHQVYVLILADFFVDIPLHLLTPLFRIITGDHLTISLYVGLFFRPIAVYNLIPSILTLFAQQLRPLLGRETIE